MATQDITLDASSAGTVIGPRDGYLVSLKMTKPPDILHPMAKNGTPFRLTDDRHDVSPGLRALVSFDPLAGWGAADGVLWRDNSIRFWGELRVMSVPPGSQWQISLSDQPTAPDAGRREIGNRPRFPGVIG